MRALTIFHLKFLICKLTKITSKFPMESCPMESCLLFTNGFENALCTFNTTSTLWCGVCRFPMVVWGSDPSFYVCGAEPVFCLQCALSLTIFPPDTELSALVEPLLGWHISLCNSTCYSKLEKAQISTNRKVLRFRKLLMIEKKKYSQEKNHRDNLVADDSS